MKLGILGTGMIVNDFLQIINKLHLEAVYLLSTRHSKEKAQKLCYHYHLNGYYLNYEDLLEADIDTIYIALPNHLHYEFAKKALQKGKHVIIEKPITPKIEALNELIELAANQKVMLFEAMVVHYLPAYQALKEKVKALGTIKIINFNFSQYSSRYDAFKRGEILPAFDYKKAGGALMDINVYNVHTIIGLFGKPMRVQYLANIENHIDTSGILLLDYGHCKAIAVGAKDCRAPMLSTIQGDKGTIWLNESANQLKSYDFIDLQGNKEHEQFDKEEHRMFYEFNTFIHIIETHDFEKANEMIQISKIAIEIIQEARAQQGIVFADEAY